MEIKNACFSQSFNKTSQLPDSKKPELAFIGRSNVGKSSLINMLTGRKGMAKTSATPGKTQCINFFDIDGSWIITDLPGYGYAKVSKTRRSEFGDLGRKYILEREQLYCVFALVDSRIPPQKLDLQFINWMGENGIPFCIVFTKADKPKRTELDKHMAEFREALSEVWDELPPMFATSSETGAGRKELLQYIGEILKGSEQ